MTEILFTQVGANDPDFNLRNDQGIIFRTKDKDHVFASIIEPHGDFDPTLEYSFNSYSTFEELDVLTENDELTVVNIKGKNNLEWMLFIVNNNSSSDTGHNYSVKGKNYEWKGPINLVKSVKEN